MDAETSARDDRRFEWQVVLDGADYRAMAAAYTKQQRRRTDAKKGLIWAKLAAWLALTVLFIAVFNTLDSEIWMAGFAGFLLGVFVLWGVLLVYNRWAMPKMIERLSGTAGKAFSVTMDPTDIDTSTDQDSLKFSWAGLSAVDETATHYFIWPNSLYALVLPKRVLRDGDEATRFAQALKDWTGGK